MAEVKFALRADRLRALREEHGWSQRELARLCGFGEGQVRKYELEGNDPSSTHLKRMAELLGVSLDFLVGLTDDPRGHVGDGTLTYDEENILGTFRRDGWSGVFKLGAERIAK